jgi:hypothetical protein
VLKRLGGQTVRRLAPRSIAALEEVVRLRQEVEDLRHRQAELEESVRRAGVELAEFRASIAGFAGDLQESRALSLRVGQLTDLVFSRLADSATTSV